MRLQSGVARAEKSMNAMRRAFWMLLHLDSWHFHSLAARINGESDQDRSKNALINGGVQLDRPENRLFNGESRHQRPSNDLVRGEARCHRRAAGSNTAHCSGVRGRKLTDIVESRRGEAAHPSFLPEYSVQGPFSLAVKAHVRRAGVLIRR